MCAVLLWGRLNGSLLVCLRKDVGLCDTASRAEKEETSERSVLLG